MFNLLILKDKRQKGAEKQEYNKQEYNRAERSLDHTYMLSTSSGLR